MKKLLFLSISVLAFCLGCKKEEPGGHPYRFNCQVDGSFWEAKYREHEGSFSRNDLDVTFDKDFHFFSFIATNKAKNEVIGLSFPFSDTSKIITKGIICDITFHTLSKCAYDFSSDSIDISKVLILEHDKTKRIIKGNFESRLRAKFVNSCLDSVIIRQGYFDVVYGIE